MTRLQRQTVIVPASKPRNPYALLARMRHAGAHEKPFKTQRHQYKQRLQTSLNALLDDDIGEFEIEFGKP